jgi:hypothetical protein
MASAPGPGDQVTHTIVAPLSQSPLPVTGEPVPTPNQSSRLKPWLWPGLLIAVVGGILCSSLYVRHGGCLHGETDMYLVVHLSEQSFWSKIICPHSADAKFYQHRPLSHVLENLDAHFIYWSYLIGWPHFFSLVTAGLLFAITCLHWRFGLTRLGLHPVTLLLLMALFWTNPNIYLSGMCLRAAKIAVAFFVYAGMCVFLSRMLTLQEEGGLRIAEPEVRNGAVLLYVGLALGACFSDPQGVFMVLLLSGGALVWAGLLKSREALLAASAGVSAAALHTLFSLWLAPALVSQWSGFEVNSAFHQFDAASLHSTGLELVKDGALLTCDTLSFGLGNLPCWVFCPLLLVVVAATFVARTETATCWQRGSLKHPGLPIGLTVLTLAVANAVMCSVMVARHAPVAWEDIRRAGYYGLPTVVLWLMVFTVLLKLLQDRFQLSRGVVWAVLAVLLAFNVESLPTHYRIYSIGHMQGFIEATPALLKELRRLRNEPARPATVKFDTQKNRELADFSNMLRNPLIDINARGSVDVDLFLKSSRFVNFLRSKKGLDFYQPGELKTQ